LSSRNAQEESPAGDSSASPEPDSLVSRDTGVAEAESTTLTEPVQAAAPPDESIITLAATPDAAEPHQDVSKEADAPNVAEAPSEVEIDVGITIPDDRMTGGTPQVVDAHEVTLTWGSTADLLKFVRFSDFVPCDFDGDGIADILALSSKASTGYGFRGIGNGLFVEGPSFDLPFRPAAAMSLGDSDETINGLFLVSASGTVSLFYPFTGEDPSTGIAPNAFNVYRVDTETGSVLTVHGGSETFVRVFLATDGSLQNLGEHSAIPTANIAGWYSDVAAWRYLDQEVPFPLPPNGVERTTRIADLNADDIPDLVYYDSGRIVCLLSREGELLVEEQAVPCSAKPVAIRIADVDADGFPDVLALMQSSGTLEVYLVEPKR